MPSNLCHEIILDSAALPFGLYVSGQCWSIPLAAKGHCHGMQIQIPMAEAETSQDLRSILVDTLMSLGMDGDSATVVSGLCSGSFAIQRLLDSSRDQVAPMPGMTLCLLFHLDVRLPEGYSITSTVAHSGQRTWRTRLPSGALLSDRFVSMAQAMIRAVNHATGTQQVSVSSAAMTRDELIDQVRDQYRRAYYDDDEIASGTALISPAYEQRIAHMCSQDLIEELVGYC